MQSVGALSPRNPKHTSPFLSPFLPFISKKLQFGHARYKFSEKSLDVLQDSAGAAQAQRECGLRLCHCGLPSTTAHKRERATTPGRGDRSWEITPVHFSLPSLLPQAVRSSLTGGCNQQNYSYIHPVPATHIKLLTPIPQDAMPVASHDFPPPPSSHPDSMPRFPILPLALRFSPVPTVLPQSSLHLYCLSYTLHTGLHL